MLKSLERLLRIHGMVINVQKTKVLIFNARNRRVSDVEFSINGCRIDIVDEYKYLGCILNKTMNESMELEGILNTFNRAVGMFLRKFSTVDLSIKLKLFTSFCMSMYGLELITQTRGCNNVLHKLSISYHHALKRLLGFPKYFSNHYTCNFLEMLVFKHFRNYRAAKFIKWLEVSDSPCIIWHKVFLTKFSAYGGYLRDVFRRNYDIIDVPDNDLDAIYSRLKYVQSREPSSSYMFFR